MIDELKKLFDHTVSTGGAKEQILFVKELIKNNDQETMEFHYKLLKSKNDDQFYLSIRSAFKKRKDAGISFLLNKLKSESDEELIADAVLILGLMKCKDVLEYCRRYIDHNNPDIRYKCIIAIGWLGGKSELSILEQKLFNDEEEKLCGYAATAMRQIWFGIPETKTEILAIFEKALKQIDSEEVVLSILTCLQDLLNLKLGINETATGMKYNGSLEEKKAKALDVLENN